MTTPSGAPPDDARGCSRAGVGCFTIFAGAISGAMVGVLISMIVAFFTRAPKCPGIPTCDWNVYAGWGALIGSITLFTLAMSRVLRPGRRDRGTHNGSDN
jgi:hypothetical protein